MYTNKIHREIAREGEGRISFAEFSRRNDLCLVMLFLKTVFSSLLSLTKDIKVVGLKNL